MEKLRVGDTFFLRENIFVMVGNWVVESGRRYDFPQDNSKSRVRLHQLITEALAKEGIKHDTSIVDRFVNYIAKDTPAGNVHLQPGDFIVTSIEPSGANEEKVFCHRVGDPTDVFHFLQNQTHGHPHFKSLR